jgi:HEAT repeat protein/beta-lactamase regulating signal transducer with metallopeptidase domain
MLSPELGDLIRAAAAPLFAWLLTYAVHSTILLGGALLLTPRIRSHGVREMLWKTALFGGFLTASLQPALRVSPLSGRMVVAAAEQRSAPPSRLEGQEQSSSESAAVQADLTPGPVSSRSSGLGLREVMVLAWGIGALTLLAVYLVRRARFLRGLAARRPVMTHALAGVLEQLSVDAGIRRPIRLTASPVLASPIALGHEEIVVPEAALSELDTDQQRGMLAHELAHLDRRDPTWLIAACVAERIGFLQPLNRVARRKMQESAEYLCDEWAVRRTGSGVFLAKCLAKVAEWMDAAPRAVPVAGMAEERSHLVARVRRLLEGAPFSRTPARRTLLTASLLAIGVTIVAVPGVSLARRQGNSADPNAELSRSLPEQGRDTTRAVVQALIDAIRDTDVEVRRAAARSLSQFEDPATLPAFREALRDADAEVRAVAAEALGERHDRGSATALAELLKDESAEVRRAAAGALGEIPRSGALAPLLAALKDPDAEVRGHVIEALSKLKDPGAVEGLIAAIKDPKPDVRARAIEALTELELEAPPEGILEALRDPHPQVRHQAAHAVGHFEDARAVPTLRLLIEDSDHEVREAAVEALSEIRNEAAIQALVAALKSKDPKIRRAAADALGQH